MWTVMGGKILEMTDNNLFPNTSFPLSTKRQTSLVYSIIKWEETVEENELGIRSSFSYTPVLEDG